MPPNFAVGISLGVLAFCDGVWGTRHKRAVAYQRVRKLSVDATRSRQ